MTAKDEGAYNFNGEPLPGLSKAVEEAGELVQVLGKLIATNGSGEHWDGELFGRLEMEMGDVYAAMDFILLHWPQVSFSVVADRREEKLRVFKGWHQTNAHQT